MPHSNESVRFLVAIQTGDRWTNHESQANVFFQGLGNEALRPMQEMEC